MFSPYYAWSRWRDPLNHCAMNVALYRLDGRAGHWAMTERGRSTLARDATSLSIGPSQMSWRGDSLHIDVDESTAPIPVRLRGTIRLTPDAIARNTYPLDREAHHHWRPIAPRARVEVAFTSPDLNWCGDAYFDANGGSEPLETRFNAWDWARAHRAHDAILFYEATQHDGSKTSLGLRIDRHGDAETIEAVARIALPGTLWGVERRAWSDGGTPPRAIRTLEDTPFYTRTTLQARILSEDATIMHESLSLERLRSPVVKAMLPFRMPRILW